MEKPGSRIQRDAPPAWEPIPGTSTSDQQAQHAEQKGTASRRR